MSGAVKKNFKLFEKFRFNFTVSKLAYNFQKKMKLNEFVQTQMVIPDNLLMQVPTKELTMNSIAASFQTNPEHLQLYKFAEENTSSDKCVNFPRFSFFQVRLPFSDNEILRRQSERFTTGRLRTGRLLESLDFLAGYTSYYHCMKDPFLQEITLVTACMQNFNIFTPIMVSNDLIINSYPTSVGRSSIEIRNDIIQYNKKDGKQYLSATAEFVMVAREAKDYTKAFQVPSLDFTGELDPENCQLRSEIGKIKALQRKSKALSSLETHPPTQEETSEIHDIFYKIKSGKIKHSTDYISISDTRKSKSILMHTQEKNIHGKIFGGYLMREAAELAWLCAYTFSKDKVEYEGIDDVVFVKPVEIGCVVTVDSRVTFTDGDLIFVQCTISKWIKEENSNQICNEIYLIFRGTQAQTPILPTTYWESMEYLEAKRRIARFLQ